MSEGFAYLKNNLEGMNNDELILFIYQEMLKILNQTLYYFENNDIENRVNAINKGIEVINALISVLNFEAGEIAFRLRSLYVYSIRKLTNANLDRSPVAIKEVLNIFKNLQEGWAEKLENDKKNNISNTPSSFSNPLPSGGGFNEGGSGGLSGLEIYG